VAGTVATQRIGDVSLPLNVVVLPRQVEDRLTYRYDFGDDWAHRTGMEKVVEAEPGIRYPLCLDGKRACPPEDCGGTYGYRELLEAIQDPDHEDHDRLLEWVGGGRGRRSAKIGV